MFPKQAAGDVDWSDDTGPQLIARLTRAEDGRMHCTIHPESATDRENTTRWITADEDSFVELEHTH